jgi:hypothetical protein
VCREQVCREQVEREHLCQVKSRDKLRLKVSALAPIFREKSSCDQSCREQVCRDSEQVCREQVCREQVERELLCQLKSRNKFRPKVSALAPILRGKVLVINPAGNKCVGNKCAGNKRAGNKRTGIKCAEKKYAGKKCAGNKRTEHTYLL